MGQFFYNVSWHRDPRIDDPRIIENEGRRYAVSACPHLDAPVDLFIKNNEIAFKPLEKPKTEFHCACGCQQRHNCAVSRVFGINGDRQVLWYRTMRCRNRHAGIVA
jgi:hypothetical protein